MNQSTHRSHHTTPARRLARAALLIGLAALTGCGAGQAAKKSENFSTSGDREADQRAEQIMTKDAQLKGGNEKQTSLGNKLGGDNKTGPQGVPKADEKKTLYDRLGGEAGIPKIVDDFVARAIADPQVNLERKGVKQGGLSIHRNASVEWQASGDNLAKLKRYMTQFVSLKTGGPAVYEGGEIKEVSQSLHFTNSELDAAIGDLKQTLDKLQIPNQEQKELIAIVESTRTQIVQE